MDYRTLRLGTSELRRNQSLLPPSLTGQPCDGRRLRYDVVMVSTHSQDHVVKAARWVREDARVCGRVRAVFEHSFTPRVRIWKQGPSSRARSGLKRMG